MGAAEGSDDVPAGHELSAARIHWSARGTSLTSSQALKKPQNMESTALRSVISPAQAAARASSR